MLRFSVGGRKNGFKMSVLETLTKTYVDKLCGEHTPCRTIGGGVGGPVRESVMQTVREIAFNGVTFKTQPAQVIVCTVYCKYDT